jgi:hypothetical protein
VKATLALEFIGADSADWLNTMTKQFNQLAPGFGDRFIGRSRSGPWVAEIIGRHPKFKLDRKFLPSNRDYTRANSKGSRGVYLWYILESNHLYQVNARVSWKNSERYFCATTESGELYYLTDGEADEWLNAL